MSSKDLIVAMREIADSIIDKMQPGKKL